MTQRTLFSGYCIDTSALIDLKPYRQEFFPSLWADLERFVKQGLLIAPKEVLSELNRQDDEISRWANQNKWMFVDLDSDQTKELSNILKVFPNIIDVDKIFDADPIIIALAKCQGWGVITNEKPSTKPKNVKIPDVCNHYHIECLSLFDFFRRQGWRY